MEITEILRNWFDENARELPWRGTRDPYLIWLSEVILQQTRVVQGWSYYERFVAAFPSVRDLAEADEQAVLKLWQGLGYYSRAHNLHMAARQVVATGKPFPAAYDELIKLKGVGAYTAAAVASIAGGEAKAVLDGNVFRVLARLFDLETPIDTTDGKKQFAALAAELLDTHDPGAHNQAMMDFGAMLCTPRSPRCQTCPLDRKCLAHARKTVSERPVKNLKRPPQDVAIHYLHYSYNGRTAIRRRTEGIWRGLYEFPQTDTPPPRAIPVYRTVHVLTHRRIHAAFYRIEAPLPLDCLSIKEEEIVAYPLPRLIERYLETI